MQNTTCCSVKIQQKQQKFLAAAAKSATSPNCRASISETTSNQTNTCKRSSFGGLSQKAHQQHQHQHNLHQHHQHQNHQHQNHQQQNHHNNHHHHHHQTHLQCSQLSDPAACGQPAVNYNYNHSNNYNYHQTHTMAHYKFHNDCQSSVLTYEQVKRLDFVMDQTVPIHGRGNFPTLYVKLKELIRLVKYKLQTKHSIEIRDVRLNGGAASYVLAPENSHYNDLDLIFGTDLSNEDQFDVIRDVVLECLKEFYPKEPQLQESHFNNNIEKVSIAENDHGVAKIDKENRLDENQSYLGDSNNINSGVQENDDDGSDKDDINNDNDNDCDDDGVGDGDQDENENEGNNIACDATKDNTGHNINASNLKNTNYQQNLKPDSQTNESHIYENSQFYQSYQMPLSNCAIKEAYVHKMVKVNDDDRWSLISLGVQQSEANCCNQTNCSLSTISRSNPINDSCQQKVLNEQHFAVTNTNENEPQRLKNQTLRAQMVSDENSNAQSHYQINYLHQQQQQQQHLDQQNHYQHQRKQSPNSIELKFVDRMRRKFEFSVDSFQIILDSLIQFYDYAPQSTIASQKILINSHPSSTMVNTRPLISKRRCTANCGNQTVLDYSSDINDHGCQIKAHGEDYHNYHHHHLHHHNHHHHNNNHHHHQHNQTNNRRFKDCYQGTKPCIRVLNASQSYYQLPIDPANSPSISSVASSSGCSSSSSVASSSSSSLSCDEDHDDLYCDGDSPSSSSASTSSLLSSTTLSLLSSDGLCSDPELANHQGSLNQSEKRNKLSSVLSIRSKKDDTADESSVAVKSIKKSIESSTAHHTVPKLVRLRNCVECIGQRTCDFEANDRTTCAVISENFYPTVIGRSEYGNFKEALYHLEKKLIATRSPEEIRGGGLLKYCNLLVKNYKPTNVYQIRTLERYMCSRFFIDFSDLNQQQAKLESYLANHFSDDPILKFDYLTILHNVVQRSTVCLMNHELRLTLNMIRDLAYEQQEQQQQHQKQQQQQQQQQQMQQNLSQQLHQPLKQYQQVQQSNLDQGQQHQQPLYYQQKPVLIQSGVYRIKLVNYTLAKPIAP